MEKLTYYESLVIIGGGEEGWDYDIAHSLGVAIGFSLKKVWKLLQFCGKNLFELQANVYIVDK